MYVGSNNNNNKKIVAAEKWTRQIWQNTLSVTTTINVNCAQIWYHQRKKCPSRWQKLLLVSRGWGESTRNMEGIQKLL